MQAHSHGDLYAKIEHQQELLAATLGLLTKAEQRIAKLEQQCKQCYLESKGAGP